MAPEAFRIGVVDRSLVVTFDQPCQVVSWAPFHGGFRSGVSRFFVRRISSTERTENVKQVLRQTVGRLKLRGTVVGAPTSTDVENCVTASVKHEDLIVSVLALLPWTKGSIGTAKDPSNLPLPTHLPHVLVCVNASLSHEAMLETMALTVDARSWLWPFSAQGKRSATASALIAVDWVVVSTSDGQRLRGGLNQLNALTVQALAQCLKRSG